jgi:hypothetical protein
MGEASHRKSIFRHGGRRAGAGRPKAPHRLDTALNIRISTAERDQLDAYITARGIPNRSAAIKQLLADALLRPGT